MAHFRKPLAAAVALNTAIFLVEGVAGVEAGSLSLIMDSVHNLSDEMALVFLYLAFVSREGLSRTLLRSANVFNSVGLILVSALLLWQAVERLLHPVAVPGIVPVVVGLGAAAGNWGVARVGLGVVVGTQARSRTRGGLGGDSCQDRGAKTELGGAHRRAGAGVEGCRGESRAAGGAFARRAGARAGRGGSLARRRRQRA